MHRTRYTAIAMLFHWVIAGFILLNLVLGFRMGSLKGLDKFTVFQLHKSVGITVLILSLGRLAWRLMNPPPPEPAGLQRWERAASKAVHWGFYVFMIGMPLSGWFLVSTAKINLPTILYHVVPWPHVPIVHDLEAGPKAEVNAASATTHLVLAWTGLSLLALHLGAVLKHVVIDDTPVLGRMLPASSGVAVAREG